VGVTNKDQALFICVLFYNHENGHSHHLLFEG
jgi:hypothetical protein